MIRPTAIRRPPLHSPDSDNRLEDVERRRGQQVRMMASTNTSLKAMGDLLGMSVAELRQRFAKELKSGHDYVYAAISVKVVAAAIGGDVRSQLAWLRQFGGWQEITRREVTGKNGEPISFRNLDAAALASVIEALGAQSTPRRGAGRNASQIDLAAADVVDMDALSGPADESSEE